MYTIPISEYSDREPGWGSLFRFDFGAYGGVSVYCYAAHFCDAVEIGAAWLRDNHPGFFVSEEDLRECVDPDSDPACPDYMDLTYTESGYLCSWEWHGHEVTDDTERRIVALRWWIAQADADDREEFDAYTAIWGVPVFVDFILRYGAHAIDRAIDALGGANL